MFELSRRALGRDWIATALLLVGGLAYVAMDSAIGWLVPATLIGGACIAALLFATRRHEPPPAVQDSFARSTTSSDVINVSRIRVAGAGGAGLMFVAGVVALQYPLSTAVLVAGAVGGAAVGLALILHRR